MLRNWGILTMAVVLVACQPTEFVQLQCTDTSCTQCDEYIFPTNTCVMAEGGYHSIGLCLNSVTFEQLLWRNTDCSGAPFSSTYLPLNTCLESIDPSSYFEDICNFNISANGRRNASRPVRIRGH
eukprot:TRINITY_DN34198_c0_g1_i1.p1 TRINITY_DN34198_c0_g1~~TRINITY_DN34198_c0_g1_i1.p1  ORF type:complete len:135 (+),score=22.06 TRINITY_DN34198_c0_g1_i1:32-406(+)